MKGRFSRQPFSSSVARICSGLRTSTQSPAFRFRFLDGFELFSTWDCISPSLDFDLDWLRAPLSVAQNHRAPIPKAPGTTPSTNGQTTTDRTLAVLGPSCSTKGARSTAIRVSTLGSPTKHGRGLGAHVAQ